MQPIEKITEKEKDIFARIVNDFGDNKNHIYNIFDKSNFPFVLRYWNNNKHDLFDVFRQNLILEKEITISMNESELEENLHQLRLRSPFYQDLWHWFFYELRDEPSHIRHNLRTLFIRNLSTNIYDGKTIFVKDYKLCTGIKAIKALKTLNDLFIHSEHFEEFRLEHSRMLNQKRIRGTLCLSIHPLDYLTMSDNLYDWNSCVSWITDCGTHRAGVIEMMNSPYVVVAYIKGEKPFYEWTNKKWRSLYIFNRDLISEVKSYPYQNPEISKNVIDWLRDLAEAAGYSEYFPTTYQVIHGTKTAVPTGTVRFYVKTHLMYNDFYAEHISYIGKQADTVNYINYSGELTCIVCGETFNPPNGEVVGCRHCYPHLYPLI